MGRAKIACTVELDADELRQQFRAGTKGGLVAAEGRADLLPPKIPEEEFQKALAMVSMAVERDCRATANHAIYGEGYRYGLKIVRDKL